jgi:hypothetical protein
MIHHDIAQLQREIRRKKEIKKKRKEERTSLETLYRYWPHTEIPKFSKTVTKWSPPAATT